jgi:SAM-dependent methyltransferase
VSDRTLRARGHAPQTPLRREPIHLAALAIALAGLAGTAGRPIAAGALSVVACLAARRLRRRLSWAAVAFAALAALVNFAPLAGPAVLALWAGAIAHDERIRRLALRDFSSPIDRLLARPGFGRGRNERCVEVPWALERVPAGARVLEVGHARAEPFYLDALLARGARVFGLDLRPKRVAGIAVACGDVRRAPFRDGAFEVVLCVSTIEHVGKRHERYGPFRASPDSASLGGMLDAARELGRLVAPGGRLLLTVPFGRAADHGWLENFSRRELGAIEAATGLAVSREDFFAYDSRAGWRRAEAADLSERDWGSHGAIAASAVACVELTARPDSR